MTGQTGFKGSWLALWLRELGAEVHGYALAPNTRPSHYGLHDWPAPAQRLGDVRDFDGLARALEESRPSVVFHLAAQPLVRESYQQPIETLSTNVMGVANLLEACRRQRGLEAIVVVTSDKVYENNEQGRPFDESDRLGGADPYSCSKACAELVTACYRASFSNGRATAATPLTATVRAGNVIGGGDWSADRLIPDAVRAASVGGTLTIRNPLSVRPWQHVLEPLAGYLTVGWRLLDKDHGAARAWNFGPEPSGHVTVRAVADAFRARWPDFEYAAPPDGDAPHEAGFLQIESSDARERLGWRPLWDWRTAVERTADWHRHFCQSGRVETMADLNAYVVNAHDHNCNWVKS